MEYSKHTTQNRQKCRRIRSNPTFSINLNGLYTCIKIHVSTRFSNVSLSTTFSKIVPFPPPWTDSYNYLLVAAYACCYSTPYSFNHSAYTDLMKESFEFIKYKVVPISIIYVVNRMNAQIELKEYNFLLKIKPFPSFLL